MQDKRYANPKYKSLLELTRAYGVLADVRRLVIFRAIVEHKRPIGFTELKEQVQVPASSLSKILQRLEEAGLIVRTTNADRSLTVTVNMPTLYKVTRYLFDAYQGLNLKTGTEGVDQNRNVKEPEGVDE